MEHKKMTMGELISILSQDGTKEQFEEAIKAGELTQEEAEKILAYLTETDRTKQRALMDDMMKTIVDIPTFDTHKEARDQWKATRLELAHDIDDLQAAMTAVEDQLTKYKDLLKAQEAQRREEEAKRQEYIDSRNGHVGKHNKVVRGHDAQLRSIDENIAETQKLIEKQQQRLKEVTLQYNATALMHAHAKSQQRQEAGQVFAEMTKPFREMLKESWQDLGKKVEMLFEHAKQRMELDKVLRETKNFDFHPIQDFENRFFMNIAKHEAKSYNRHAAKVDKLEQKILDKANKIRRAEYRKEHGMGAIVSAFAKGQKVERPEFKEFGKDDLDVAKEMLGQSYLTKAYKTAVELRDSKKESLDHTLSIVAKNLSERRQSVQQTLDQIVQRADRGDFGYGDRAEKKLGEIGENMGNAVGGTAFNKDQLDPTLLAYLQAHGHTAFFDQEASFAQDLLDFGQEKGGLTQEEMDSLLHATNFIESKLENGEELTQADLDVLLSAHENGIELDDASLQALLDAHEQGVIKIGDDTLSELEEILEDHSHADPVLE